MQQKCTSNRPKAGKSKSKALTDLMSGEDPHSGSQKADILLCPHTVKGDKKIIWGLFFKKKALISLTSWSNHFLQTSLPTIIPMGIRFQHRNFGGTPNWR